MPKIPTAQSRAPSHKDLVKAIKSLITEHGGFVYKHYSGGPMGLNGVADLIGVYRGRGVAIEVKTGKDKLSEKQAKFLERWKAAGGIGIEARSIEDVIGELDIPTLF
jgi:hypothetical protein